MTAVDHVGDHVLCKAEQSERPHAPAKFEGFGRRIRKTAITDLGPQVVDRHINRADVGLKVVHQRFYLAFIDGVQESAGGAATG